MNLNWLLLYAISINVELGLQKIIRLGQSRLGGDASKDQFWVDPFEYECVNLDSSFANISSLGEKGKGL